MQAALALPSEEPQSCFFFPLLSFLFYLFFLFGDKFSCSPGYPQTHYMVEIDLELVILLPLPSE